MKSAYVRLLEAIGVCIFFASIVSVLIFAEGYQFDPHTIDLVKRGIIVIDGVLPQRAQFFLDGVIESNSPEGEIRTSMGMHRLTIVAQGYHEFQKTLNVNDTTVLRIKAVMLVPEVLPGDLYALHTLSSMTPAMRTYEVPRGLFVERPNLHAGVALDLSSTRNLKAFELPFQYTKVLPAGDDLLIGLDLSNEMFVFENGETKHIGARARDIALLEDSAVSITFDGKVARWDKRLAPNGVSFNLPEAKSREWQFTHVREGNDFIALTTLNSAGESVLTVIDSANKIIIQRSGIGAFALEDTVLTYVAGTTMTRVNLDRSSETLSRAIRPTVAWFSPVGESNHVLSMSPEGNLTLCDSDFENCHDLVLRSDSVPVVSRDRLTFAISSKSSLQALVFENTASFSDILRNLHEFGAAFALERKSS